MRWRPFHARNIKVYYVFQEGNTDFLGMKTDDIYIMPTYPDGFVKTHQFNVLINLQVDIYIYI